MLVYFLLTIVIQQSLYISQFENFQIYTNVKGKCIDINECLENNPCDTNAECKNTFGAVQCECKKGFVGDGFLLGCTDVNECDNDPCTDNR